MMQNVSFFMPGGRAGVLLIHGLTGTPAEMHILARGLNRAGFTVYGMQLAGHCGTAADLRQTGWRDWYQSVERAADFMRRRVDMLFVGGLSMGAVLALRLAALSPGKVQAVGVYGATFRYDGWSVPFYARRFGFLVRLFKRLGLFQDKIFMESPPYGVKDERIRKTVEESLFSGDSAKAGLIGNPWPSLAEMQWLNKATRPLLPQVRAPCLVMHAAEDDTASLRSNGAMVAQTVAGRAELVPLANSYHLITIDRDRRQVIEKSAEFFGALCGTKMLAAPLAGTEELIGAAITEEAAQPLAKGAAAG